MFKHIRHQCDELQAKFSLEAGLLCPPDEDRARQEFAAEADVNLLVKRFGGNLNNRVPEYQDVDYSVSLQDSFLIAEAARAAYEALKGRGAPVDVAVTPSATPSA